MKEEGIKMTDAGKILNSREMKELLHNLAVRLNKRYPNKEIDFYIVGVCALVMGYATRSGSTDIDAFWTDDLDMAKEINVIAKQYNIESGWLNSDFKKSESYTPAILYNSTLYAKELNCNFYIVNPELLLCMKLISFRRNKHDIADIYNIVEILNKRGVTLTPELIVSWLERFYHPVPQLKQGALDLIYGR